MNIIDTLYDNEDLSTDDGIEAICEKIKNLNVSFAEHSFFEVITRNILGNHNKYFASVNKTNTDRAE